MNSRHHAREVALQILYRYDIAVQSGGKIPELGPALIEDLQRHFDHFKVPENLRGFAAELVAGTLRETAAIDALIEQHTENWKITRMALIDRNLLRMATFELSHFQDIPANVTLDEAIELAKQFGTTDTASFINGVLDSILKSRVKTAES